jgi:hypothetical protein
MSEMCAPCAGTTNAEDWLRLIKAEYLDHP